MAVIARVNPIIRGWANYYRNAVSSDMSAKLDSYLFWISYKWARHQHQKKARRWIARQYFGRFNQSRNDLWVFGDRATGAYLQRFAWTKIVRHAQVKYGASLDDPALSHIGHNDGQNVSRVRSGVLHCPRGLLEPCAVKKLQARMLLWMSSRLFN